jgi:ubiquitin-like-conjugating enzyme ATG10
METMYAFCKRADKSADPVHQQTLTRYPRSSRKTVILDFSIILSPTYQVPVLWFTAGQLGLHRPWVLDTVYSHLVPNLQQDQLRQVGVLGGISMAV